MTIGISNSFAPAIDYGGDVFVISSGVNGPAGFGLARYPR